MKRALFVAALAIVCWLVFGAHDASWARQGAPAGSARQRTLSDQLRYLGSGSEVTVYLTDGSKVEAVLREVQDDAIVVVPRKGGKSTTIMLAEIQRLQTGGKSHRVTYVVLGVVGTLLVVAVSAC
jgi:hypothetical protein